MATPADMDDGAALARSAFPDRRPIGPEMHKPGKSPDLQTSEHPLRGFAAGLLGLCGAYQIGLGVYFIALRPPLLPEDLRYFGVGRETVRAVLPRLEPWLHLVFTVLGGQMAALGVLVVAAAFRLRDRQATNRGELVLSGMAGALSVGLMSSVNFALGSDFRWLLILPAGIWALGFLLALRTQPRASSTEDKHAR